MTQTNILILSCYLIWTLTSLGLLFDKHELALKSEVARISITLASYWSLGVFATSDFVNQAIMITNGASLAITTIILLSQPSAAKKTK